MDNVSTMTSSVRIYFVEKHRDIIPVIIFAVLALIVFFICLYIQIKEKMKMAENSDPPPSYAESPQFPPTYESAIFQDRPPSYAFGNDAFEEDPPEYVTVLFENIIQTSQTTVFV